MLRNVIAFSVYFTVIAGYNLDTRNPLIYTFPGSYGRSSYFGMSVAIRPEASTIKDSWILQIGAPRGNISGINVKEPGAVYRCNLFGPCRPFIMDPNGNVPGLNYNHRYKDRKNEGWTGISMDIKSNLEVVKTVVCGSRWSNQNLTNDDNIGVTYLMTGVCYLQDICNCSYEYPVFKLLPLVDSDKIYFPKPYAFDKSFYYWGLGQAGISSALLDDLSGIIMGAPGYNNWLGTVIHYNTDLRRYDFKVSLFEETKEFKRNSYPYIGYQVSYGRFFSDKKLWLVTSAPRAENYHGKVLIFQFKSSIGQVYIASELVGTSFGEYFGASITVSDINNDGYDDLVVGAPLFSHKYPEEGRIYVYLGTNRGNFLFRSQVINGRSEYSRFGSCVASIDDLDQDGYKDIAVGAPYESGGTGAVYIFRGTKKGLEMEYSQRILAKEMDLLLRGFGISISRAIDVDGNKYNDLAVGAYKSDQVVILRSRPIIHLHPHVRVEDVFLLDRKASFFNITVCMKYSGSNAPHLVRLLRTIEFDINHNRVYFGHEKSVDRQNITLLVNDIACELFSVIIRPDISNFKPIQITVKAELPPDNANGTESVIVWDEDVEIKDKFMKWAPMGKKKETGIEIPFAGECGPDNICQPDLMLHCDVKRIQKNNYIIVTPEFLTLTLDLSNKGEPSHNTEILIYSNIDLGVSDLIDGDEVHVTSRKFHIDVGTLTSNFQTNFTFKIAIDSLYSNDSRELEEGNDLILKVEAQSEGKEDSLNHICYMNYKLISDSAVDLYSSTTQTSSFQTKNTTMLNFTLYFEVQKEGDTPVTEAELNIYVPSFIDYGEETEFSSVKVETSEWMYSSVNYEEHQEWVGFSEVDTTWLNINSSNALLPIARTLFLNCSTPGIRCKTVTVVFQDGIPSHVSSYVKLFVTLNLEAIGSLLGEKDIIHFSSFAMLEFRKVLEAERKQLYSQSSISLYKEEEAKRVEPYVIALSVIAGALLLSLITSALVKYEFFRRKKKEELKALKTQELQRQSDLEFPPEILDKSECAAEEVKE